MGDGNQHCTMAGTSSRQPAQGAGNRTVERAVLRGEPAKSAPALGPDRRAAQGQPLNPVAACQRALVIDDDDFVCRTVAALLKNAGVADVTAVSDGLQAVRLINEGAPYDLIISDLSMPKFD